MSNVDRMVLQNRGGLARTAADYAMFSTGYEVSPRGAQPHSTEVRVWVGNALVLVHCSGTAVSIRRGPEHLHSHGDSLMLCMPNTGSVVAQQAGQEFELSPGELGAVAYHQQFKVTARPESSMFLLYLSDERLGSRGMSPKEFTARKWVEGPLLPTLLTLLRQLFKTRDTDSSMSVENALFEVLVNILCVNPITGRGVSTDERLRMELLQTLERQFHDPDLTAGMLAKELGVSRRYLYDLMEPSGLSVGSVLRTRRVDHGARLLQAKPDLSLRHVAKLSGFHGPDQFTRAFKAVFDTTPSQFRRRITDVEPKGLSSPLNT